MTPGAFDTTYAAGFFQFDVFVQKVAPPINDFAGVAVIGAGTAGCAGPQTLAVHSTPKVNNPYFAFTCTNTPPSALGLLLYTTASVPAGIDTLGIGALQHVDLGTLVDFADIVSVPQRSATRRVPIPNDPALVGQQLSVQSFWLWSAPDACPQLPFGLSSSNALEITIQS
ncbi:MAG: hypothetical protein JNJ88_00275 [Planctomycetes bacterium]|nr:hypothetical protein [Planctomycetota bacterium]